MTAQKPVFGWAEAIFDLLYLLAAASIGLWLLHTPGPTGRALAGQSALLLAGGDAFHLLPRIAAVLTGRRQALAKAMAVGKLVTSITMTGFYLLLWRLGLLLFSPSLPSFCSALIYGLAILRGALCLLPQNRWLDPRPPLRWGIYRNIPFLLLGLGVAALFAACQGAAPAVTNMAFAILLSFGFYLPVVIWADKNPKLGMLMLPKTCAYLWMLSMFLAL
jgi:hypothetical protein